MNLLLFDPAELDRARGGASGAAEIDLPADDRRARHLRTVLRVRPGQVVRAGAVRGPTGSAEVVAVDEQRVRLRVVLDRTAAARPAVDLILAVPRPKALSRVLETAASFGVGRIDLVNAWRVDRSYLDSPRLGPAELDAALRLGCEQGATTWLPDIGLERLLVPYLARGPDRWAEGGHRLIAHPRADAPIEAIVRPGARAPVLIAIGPEGGWIDRELDSFAALGFAPVHLGAPVLRVEAAVAALLSQLQLLGRLPAGG
ncbi:MAG TPA: RsmE family RNA methyltransferase [Kofleriaceae bacterium]|nr:RsmE family RNA methyltransferase [Kofleriaceae bacterium]